MNRDTLRGAIVGCLLSMLFVFGFMTADRAYLHWYVPHASDEEVADRVAGRLLGEWDRSVPDSRRTEDNYRFLRESVRQPESEGSAAQFQRALTRIANASAIPLVGAQLRNASERRALDTLQQCMDFLLGVNAATASCNLAPIAP